MCTQANCFSKMITEFEFVSQAKHYFDILYVASTEPNTQKIIKVRFLLKNH